MATVKTGTGIISIKGTVAGNVYRRSKHGQTIQATPRAVAKTPSSSQKKRRNAWRTCQNYIQSNVSSQLTQRWTAYAEQHPVTNKIGEKKTLTWLQMFMSINIIRVYNDVAVLQYPPD